MVVEVHHRRRQLLAERGHAGVEAVDVVLADQPHARLGVRQRQALPERDDLGADGGDLLERLVLGVEQLLRRRQILSLGPEVLGRLGLLLGAEGLADAEPGEAHADGREVQPQARERR